MLPLTTDHFPLANHKIICYAQFTLDADVAKLADALDLGSSTVRCEGSSPFIRTYKIQREIFAIR
jgi:hypothetical protein